MINKTIITLDCDWAPDFILDSVFEKLENLKIKSTWFITNNSKFVQKNHDNPLIELGLHPNFSPDSTQGKTPESILENLKNILPHAKSIRTHGLMQSSNLLSKFHDFGIENDVSIILPRTINIIPHYSKYLKLFRYPFFWEDDEEFSYFNWSLDALMLKTSGMKIFDFHPIHIFLNSNNIDSYLKLKDDIGLRNVSESNIHEFINTSESGVGTFFTELIKSISTTESYTIKGLTQKFGDEIKF